jgi:hypothetical protein
MATTWNTVEHPEGLRGIKANSSNTWEQYRRVFFWIFRSIRTGPNLSSKDGAMVPHPAAFCILVPF